LKRFTYATTQQHVDSGTINSAEQLSEYISILQNLALSTGEKIPELRRLNGAIRQAFSKRRSLLLTNYEH
jgi:hypothetical protein